MDWALLPLSTKGCLVRWFCESEVRFQGDADHGVPFHCLRRGHYATQLDPWCGTLLCPDCTRSEELVQNFHRRVTCHRHTGRSRLPPPGLRGPCERSYQVTLDGAFVMASWWMLCILSRESIKQPVQPFKGIWSSQRWWSSGGTTRVNGLVAT